MRNIEFAVALAAAVIVFAALKVIGLIVKFALIAALLGFAGGWILARSYRQD